MGDVVHINDIEYILDNENIVGIADPVSGFEIYKDGSHVSIGGCLIPKNKAEILLTAWVALSNPEILKEDGCHCEGVTIGGYENQVEMVVPEHIDIRFCDGSKKQSVCIDTCLATEIGYLWHQGVITLNSCCGHNLGKIKPSIIVDERSYKKMHELGYDLEDESRKDIFKSKSI